MERHDIELKSDPLVSTQNPNQEVAPIPPQKPPKSPPPPPPPRSKTTQRQTSQNEPLQEPPLPPPPGPTQTSPPAKRASLATPLTTLPPSYPHAPLPPSFVDARTLNPPAPPSHQSTLSFLPSYQQNQSQPPPPNQNIPYEFYAPTIVPRLPQSQPPHNVTEFYAPTLPPPPYPQHQARNINSQNLPPFNESLARRRIRYGCTPCCWLVSICMSLLIAGLVVAVVWYEEGRGRRCWGC